MTLRDRFKNKTSGVYQPLVLHHPVYTLDNRELLPAGCTLNSDTLQFIISSNKTSRLKTYRLLDYGSTKKDLLYFLQIPPYQTIFNDKKFVSDLVQLMENVSLALPFLESLDYFLEHDSYTYRHILMVFALSTLLAKDLISNYKQHIKKVLTSPTHDLGKTCIPLKILKKTTPLTKAELRALEHHTTAGYVLVSYYHHDRMDLAAILARDHHEKKNGTGYPRGIELNDLLVEIIAACDAYDALISPRPYRPVSFDNRTALEEITSRAERNEVNWDVVRRLIAYNRKNNSSSTISKVEADISLDKRGEEPPGNLYGRIAEEQNITGL
jgi:HD-GYP domain-containing protein (c-di-GMP phosphodiesterase class II)